MSTNWRMKTWLVVISLSLLSGCSTLQPSLTTRLEAYIPQVDSPNYSESTQIQGIALVPKDRIEAPIDIGGYPRADLITFHNVDYAGFDKAGFDKLMDLRDAYETNYQMYLYLESAEQQRTLLANQYLQLAKDQETETNLWKQKTAVAEKETSLAKRQAFLDKWKERFIFGGTLFLLLTVHTPL